MYAFFISFHFISIFFFLFLISVFFLICSTDLWSDKANRRKFFENYAHARKFDPLDPEEWYKVPTNRILIRKVQSALFSSSFLLLSFLFLSFLFISFVGGKENNISTGRLESVVLSQPQPVSGPAGSVSRDWT